MRFHHPISARTSTFGVLVLGAVLTAGTLQAGETVGPEGRSGLLKVVAAAPVSPNGAPSDVASVLEIASFAAELDAVIAGIPTTVGARKTRAGAGSEPVRGWAAIGVEPTAVADSGVRGE